MSGAEQPNEALVSLVRDYILQVVAIHYELFNRLFESELDLPPGIAEALEDAANTYLDFADQIIERRLQAKIPTAPAD